MEEKISEDIEKSVEKPKLLDLLPITISISFVRFLKSLPVMYNERKERNRLINEEKNREEEELKRLEEEELKKIGRAINYLFIT